MKNILKKKALLNVVTNLALQVCTIISGFIIPKLILSSFGSEVNGLVSSLTQFLSYITLVEGGITGVIMASLYKPLHNKDQEKVSSIVCTATKFFRKIGWIYVAYSLVLAIAYPLLSGVEFSFAYVASLTMILSFTTLLQYMFSIPLQVLLKADRRAYVVSLVQIIVTILNIVLAVVVVGLCPSIHVLKLVASALYVIQPMAYNMYLNKHLRINKNAKIDNNLIKNRWKGFTINLAAFIHNSTDITILTIFTNLSTVSVYAVYALVTSGLKKIVSAVAGAISPSIGKIYASGDLKKLDKKMDTYEFILFFLVFFLYTLAGLLITPFVLVYTKGVTDVDYNQPIFGVLIVLAEAVYLIKHAHLNLAYSADRFKDITWPAVIEAIINIVLSLVLVGKLGLVGVSIGTLVAMLYRMVFHVWYTKKIIPFRKQIVFYKKLVAFSFATICDVFLCYFIFPIVELNVVQWVLHALVYAAILFVTYAILSLVLCRKEIRMMKEYLK